MSYYISQEEDSGFRFDTSKLLTALTRDWAEASVRELTCHYFSHEWSIQTPAGRLDGELNRKQTSVVLDGELEAAAAFAVWLQKVVVCEDQTLKFYDESYDPVAALDNNTTEADIVNVMQFDGYEV